jgi:hypothetical protein
VVLGWPPVLLLLLSVVGGRWSGRSGDVVDFSTLPFRGDAPWRIKEELGRSGPLVSVLDRVDFFFCPSLVFVGADDGVSGRVLERFGYQLGRPGWCVVTTLSGGLHPLLGSLYTGVLGLKLCEVSGLFNTGEGIASGHPDRPARSTVSQHVGFSDMILWVPLENLKLLRREGGRLQGVSSGRRRRERPGASYKDLFVIFIFSKGVFVSCMM